MLLNDANFLWLLTLVLHDIQNIFHHSQKLCKNLVVRKEAGICYCLSDTLKLLIKGAWRSTVLRNDP